MLDNSRVESGRLEAGRGGARSVTVPANHPIGIEPQSRHFGGGEIAVVPVARALRRREHKPRLLDTAHLARGQAMSREGEDPGAGRVGGADIGLWLARLPGTAAELEAMRTALGAPDRRPRGIYLPDG